MWRVFAMVLYRLLTAGKLWQITRMDGHGVVREKEVELTVGANGGCCGGITRRLCRPGYPGAKWRVMAQLLER